jgi:glycosyltransferase involved in cell wall biosynthesis
MSQSSPETLRTPAAGLGYLLSKYPSANHTYLLREVRGLRAAGLGVLVCAIDGDDRPAEALPQEDAEERRGTFVVKRSGAAHVAAAHARTLVTRPAGYVAGLLMALRLAGADVGRLLYQMLYFGEAVVAGHFLSRGGCTHVHTHYASNVAILAARVFGFGVSATIHGSAEFIDPKAQRLTEKIAACDFVRAISAYGRSQLMLASPVEEWHKFDVVRLGIDPSAFAPAHPAPTPTDPVGLFRIVSVGQLQPAKGFHLLLDAVAAAAGAGHNVALTIVGDGGLRGSLDAYAVRLGIRDLVTFPGALNQRDVREVLRRADAFVLASFAEGIPVVLMEAMAAGLPCIATRITGIPELIDDGREGILTTPSDVDALARAIGLLAADADLRARMGSAGRERVSRNPKRTSTTAPRPQPVGRP